MSCHHFVNHIIDAINDIERTKCINISLNNKKGAINIINYVKEAIEDLEYMVLN